MTTTEMGMYPKQLTLTRGGGDITIRPLERGDGPRLLEFFLGVPEEDRTFLKNDVTSPQVVNSWVDDIDYDIVFPLVATAGTRIIADGTLHRAQEWERRHLGELRIVVGPRYRNQGIGTSIARELIDTAYHNGLARVSTDLVEGKQDTAIMLLEGLGFTKQATYFNFIRTTDGNRHNLVIMERPLHIWPYWR
jgi:ribosomal protein S18 acetylase RimI-like enzyme